MPLSRISLLVIALILLAGCTAAQNQVQISRSWNYSDLRAVSSTQIDEWPNQDLLAAYTRQNGPEWQIRLDFLDLSSPPDLDVYLAIDTGTGGTTSLPLDENAAIQWDTLLVIPASGQIEALTPDPFRPSKLIPRPGMRIRVIRDPVMDTLEISFNRAALDAPYGFKLQVFVTPAGLKSPVDRLGPVRSDGPPPPQANVLLAFWDTLPAYTPAQALRRWDGAHTGPLGGRHGLNNLLHAARITQTPLTTLDLKLPASLAALDSVQGTKLVDKLIALGLLITPDNLPGFAADQLPAALPGWSLERFQSESRQTGENFGLSPSQFNFAPLGLAQEIQPVARNTRILIIPGSADTPELQPVEMMRWSHFKVISIPGYGSQAQAIQQASLDGPTIPVRQALVKAAASANPNGSSILVLGGDLPATVWGNPNAALATMKYLAAHPWVHVMNAHDLLAMNPADPAANIDPSLPSAISKALDPMIERLQHAPDNLLGEEAWQMYEALFEPTFPDPSELPALRSKYLGQVNNLLDAAEWAACENGDGEVGQDCPGPGKIQVNCTTDTDLDGQAECLMVSKNFFGVYEISGGYLSFAFVLDGDGNAHQLVAPSAELLSGLSESTTWNLSAGMGADPAVIPGAFNELTPLGTSDLSTVYQFDILSDGIQFTTPDGKRVKTFHLSPDHLNVTYQVSAPLITQIPLILDPWLRFTPDWFDQYSSGQDGQAWYWFVQPKSQNQGDPSASQNLPFKIEIRSSAPFSTYTFKDTQDILASPENPNHDNPPGHFLPFPMAMVELNTQQNFSVQLDFSSIEK